MKFSGTLLVVKDIEKAKTFYCDLLGMTITSDLGANVSMLGGLSLQTLESWKSFIHKNERDIIFKNNAIELFYEVEDLDAFSSKVASFGGIEYVHDIIEQPWGQRAIRLYDMDKHIVEVGEDMAVVVNRFLNSGLSPEQTAERMGVPIDYVEYYIA